MIDPAVWAGVQTLLDDYACIGPGDRVILLYTGDSHEPTAWVSAALELRGISCRRVWMRRIMDDGFADRLEAALPPPESLTPPDMLSRPDVRSPPNIRAPQTTGASPLPHRPVSQAVSQAVSHAARLVVFSFERDTMSHAQALAATLARYRPESYAVFRAIGACADLFAYALRATPGQLEARNTMLLERCRAARHLRIRTRGGTDLVVTLDNDRHRWISNRGAARPGGTVILPAGEVATYPAAIDGIFVADFAFNANVLTELDARLHDHPVTIRVEDGRAVDYACADPATKHFIDSCFARENARNVGELGFGTNPGIGDAVPHNSHINERRPGIHLGFGQHNQRLDIVPYRCILHLDLMTRGAVVSLDDDPTPIDLEALAPSSGRHPANLTEEDVFSPDLSG